MPKSPPGHRPDPMVREVDRLLAQLANSGPRKAQDQAASHNGAPGQRSVTPRRSRAIVLSGKPAGRGELIALWARLLLGITLGAAITQWPYPHGCDLPLLAYLGAAGTVMVAGGWVALAAWRLRSGPVHVVSLILLLWGIVLSAEQVLPRVGYAAERASWRCAAGLPGAQHGQRGGGPVLWSATR
jgi:hypothetical protein